jgi:hypothetical protein
MRKAHTSGSIAAFIRDTQRPKLKTDVERAECDLHIAELSGDRPTQDQCFEALIRAQGVM